MGVKRILRSRLAEAKGSGAKTLELEQLGEDEVEELATETLAYLRSRPGRPSSTSGWTVVAASKAGVIGWWAEEAGLTTESQRRSLRPLRRQIYDLLDERGLIVKPVGPGAVVQVSPVSDMAQVTESAEATEPQPEGAEAAEPESAKATAPNPSQPKAPNPSQPKAPNPSQPKAPNPSQPRPRNPTAWAPGYSAQIPRSGTWSALSPTAKTQ